jgi:hypothetical protein
VAENIEKGDAGYPLERPAEPATVAHTVRESTTLAKLADELGVELEQLYKHNAELLGGWLRHRRTGELIHVVEVPQGTIVHLPAGTVVPEPNDPATDPEAGDQEPPAASRTRSKGA